MMYTSSCFDCGATASSNVSQEEAERMRDAACTCSSDEEAGQ